MLGPKDPPAPLIKNLVNKFFLIDPYNPLQHAQRVSSKFVDTLRKSTIPGEAIIIRAIIIVAKPLDSFRESTLPSSNLGPLLFESNFKNMPLNISNKENILKCIPLKMFSLLLRIHALTLFYIHFFVLGNYTRVFRIIVI